MNKDQVKGRVEETKGKIKEAAGVILDDKGMEIKDSAMLNSRLEHEFGRIKQYLNDW